MDWDRVFVLVGIGVVGWAVVTNAGVLGYSVTRLLDHRLSPAWLFPVWPLLTVLGEATSRLFVWLFAGRIPLRTSFEDQDVVFVLLNAIGSLGGIFYGRYVLARAAQTRRGATTP